MCRLDEVLNGKKIYKQKHQSKMNFKLQYCDKTLHS